MLGLADRELVFELLESVMSGRPAAVLAITDRAYEHGADLGAILGDLLELVHTLTRLKSVPALRESPDIPEAERIRGAALADQLSIPVLGRAWQMLLKGTAEVEAAPDRRAAAEMVLIRLCHVANLPTPGDIVRHLADTSSAGLPRAEVPTASMPTTPRSAGAAQPLASGAAAAALAVAENAAPEPRFGNFRDVTAFVAEQRQAMLHAHLVHSVHVVRFAPPVIELRPRPEAPKDLASRLATLLSEATGTRWTIALSAAEGQPTLAERGNAADAMRRATAEDHPLVRAILDTFPGARINGVHDSDVDAYGLPVESEADAEPDPADASDFELPEAEPSEATEPDP
jgi:DNA polymerase-3 subunit gamma/tau